jgi:hypothetical protein
MVRVIDVLNLWLRPSGALASPDAVKEIAIVLFMTAEGTLAAVAGPERQTRKNEADVNKHSRAYAKSLNSMANPPQDSNE